MSTMEEGTRSENHLTSAAAFVEGGTQDACDDACSICLEAFSESDPPAVTGCEHEFHLQCILEWCQRSSQCPMCWQSISLKDPSSQELLDAIEQERSIANNPSMNATIFHHPTFGDFELQHLPVSATDAELEEHIIQYWVADAAMARARHIARRESHRSRTSVQGRPRYLGFTAQPSVPSRTQPSISSDTVGSTPAIGGTPSVTLQEESVRTIAPSSSVHATVYPASPLVSSVVPASPHETPSTNRRSFMQSSPNNQDRAGPSELQSFSESFKTRVNAMSMRYKESITKSTRSLKERLFSRNNCGTDLGSKVRGEGNAGISTLSRMIDHLEQDLAPVSNSMDAISLRSDQGSQRTAEMAANNSASQNEMTGLKMDKGKSVAESSEMKSNEMAKHDDLIPNIKDPNVRRALRISEVHEMTPPDSPRTAQWAKENLGNPLYPTDYESVDEHVMNDEGPSSPPYSPRPTKWALKALGPVSHAPQSDSEEDLEEGAYTIPMEGNQEVEPEGELPNDDEENLKVDPEMPPLEDEDGNIVGAVAIKEPVGMIDPEIEEVMEDDSEEELEQEQEGEEELQSEVSYDDNQSSPVHLGREGYIVIQEEIRELNKQKREAEESIATLEEELKRLKKPLKEKIRERIMNVATQVKDVVHRFND